MQAWMWMAIISGILLGVYDIFKKKALEKSSVLNVLALYSLFCFLFVLFEINNALKVEPYSLLLILVKVIVIYTGWIMGFAALRNMPISIITPFNTLTPVFSIILGMLMLHERLSYIQIAGVVIILAAYYLIRKSGKSEIGNVFKSRYFYLMVGSAFLNAISAIIDKFLLKTVNTGQLQFWFYFFITLLYFATLFYKSRGQGGSPVKIHYFIPLMSVFLVASDRIYFTAVNVTSSQISIIMPLRGVSVLVSAIIGGVLLKEKNIKAKFLAVCILIAGIAVLFMGK